LFVRPPSLFVIERDAKPALKGLRDARVGFALVSPSKLPDEFSAREVNTPLGEALFRCELNEAKNHLVVKRGGKSKFIRCCDGELSRDRRLCGFIENRIRKDEGLLPLRDRVGERRERKFGEV